MFELFLTRRKSTAPDKLLFLLAWTVFLAPVSTDALSQPSSIASPEYSSSVYFDQSKARDSIDQACYTSSKFWDQVDQSISLPNWQTHPDYRRFHGFCDNLRTKTPGAEVTRPNGQQLLEQYVFPGIDESDGVHRSAYPTEHYSELQRIQQRLAKSVPRVAQRELQELLQARPLVNDDESFDMEENDGDTWQRAAWYGWQFLSLRGATRWMPATSKALHRAMHPAHRFVGISRQRPHCEGTVHSDGRNYMLSTLTPLNQPKSCGIIVNDIDAEICTQPVILDNTFLHHIYNNGDDDRFCVIAECWHPALTKLEREALATLFAVKDRFTVLDLALAPWGYDDDSLEFALSSGAVHDLHFWRDIEYSRNSQPTTIEKSFGSRRKRSKKGKQASKSSKGFGSN